MITLRRQLLRLLPFLCGGHRQLALENVVLRRQLAGSKRTVVRPRLRTTDRLVWAGLVRSRTGWRQSLVIVAPDTVLRWQRRTPPSQTRPTFLANHGSDLVAIDVFPVPTAPWHVLFVLIVLAHDRRGLVHVHVTEHPAAHWTAQQIVDAFPNDSAPSSLLRDRHHVEGELFRRRVNDLRIAHLRPHHRLKPRCRPWGCGIGSSGSSENLGGLLGRQGGGGGPGNLR